MHTSHLQDNNYTPYLHWKKKPSSTNALSLHTKALHDTKVLYSARKNELDYHTIDKLCSINDGFKDFINRTIHVINAKNDTVEFIKQGLTDICDKGFTSDEARLQYCKENHIPC